MRASPWFLLPTLLWLTSCARHQGSDELEKGHPAIREARERVQLQDPDGAEALLLEALCRDPDLALAHLQLGMVYQSREQSIEALYHFRRYLAARPDSAKAKILEQVVEDERRRLAARVDRDVLTPASLAEEQAELRSRLEETQRRLAEAEVLLQQARLHQGDVPETPPPEWARERIGLLREIERLRQGTASATPESEPGEQPVDRRYVVQRGDTLGRIAQKTYGRASAWEKIYAANRDVIPNKNVLSPGTELKLPQ